MLYNYLAGFAAPDDFIFALSNRGNERLLLNVVDHLLPGSFRSKQKKFPKIISEIFWVFWEFCRLMLLFLSFVVVISESFILHGFESPLSWAGLALKNPPKKKPPKKTQKKPPKKNH
jgi:hypothetical protein